MATESTFRPSTTRTTSVNATSQKHPAVKVRLRVSDTDLSTASFYIDLAKLGLLVNEMGCATRLAKAISSTYIPLHDVCYNAWTRWHGARFWWRSESPDTPFASYCNPSQIECFDDHMHDHDFIIELCKKFEEEALNVIKAIENFWTNMNPETQSAWLATPDTGIRL